MKISVNKQIKAAGFTLIEMIGVLAVIAILASLLIPKIFNAINDAKINNTVLSYNTLRTAVMDHYGKFGSFTATTNGVALPAGASPTVPGTGTPGLAYFDSVLLTEGLIDKPFYVKLGTNSYVHIVVPPATIPTYDLDGISGSETASATVLSEAVIQGVPYLDAKDVNDRLDGSANPFNLGTVPQDDTVGRVRYVNSTQTLSVYIAHR
jgi:prepilin-type N-terminal cleavage/methylation domain-containing protein